MIKLKKVVGQLEVNAFDTIVTQFTKTKADNYLFLLRSYRESSISDIEIMNKLSLSNNSLYVLKSRLYDKIQSNLSTNIDLTKEDVLDQFHQLTAIAYNTPREVATALLNKLEEDLLHFELHNELAILYSILKRVHLYSDKYFHYSQLYNKQVALTLSVEKSLDILGTFNKKLTQYLYSRSEDFLHELLFLYKDIDDYFTLNPSRPIEIIKNFMGLQLSLFCAELQQLDQEEILNKTKKIISELPDSSPFKTWGLPLEYLYFEFYLKTQNIAKAKASFEKLEANLNCLLLSSGICLTSNFLTSKLHFLYTLKKEDDIKEIDPDIVLQDPNDTYCTIKIGIYKAMILFSKGKPKESLHILNRILSDNSFKDYIHINLEIKLTLAYIYLTLQEFDLANNILKNMHRKIKTDHEAQYSAVFDLIKVFNTIISSGDLNAKNEKQNDHMALFVNRNKGKYQLIDYLIPYLEKKFTKH